MNAKGSCCGHILVPTENSSAKDLLHFFHGNKSGHLENTRFNVGIYKKTGGRKFGCFIPSRSILGRNEADRLASLLKKKRLQKYIN